MPLLQVKGEVKLYLDTLTSRLGLRLRKAAVHGSAHGRVLLKPRSQAERRLAASLGQGQGSWGVRKKQTNKKP